MTEQTHRPGLWSAPGDGVLARAGELILLSGPAEAALLDQLLAALEQAAAAGAGGRRLADAVEDILGDAGTVPVIALGPSGTGLVALVAGTAWANVTTTEVRQALPAGRPGWLVRSTLPGPVLAIHAGLDAGQRDAARTDRYSHLDRGSVRAGSLSYYAASPAGARPAPEPAAADRAGQAAPPDAGEPEEGMPGVGARPDAPGAAAGPAAAAAADRDTEAHSAPPAAAPRSPQERRALGGGQSSDVLQPDDDQAPAAGQPSDPARPPAADGPVQPAQPPAASEPSQPGPPAAASRPFADAVAEGSAAGADAGARVPAPEAAAGAAASPPPAAAAGAVASPPPAAGQPFDAVLLTGGSLGDALSETGERAPLPPAAEPAPAVPGAAAEPMIMGAYCKNGHFDDPQARFCAVCGISMNQQTLTPRLGPRPPLGLLLLDTGAVLQLDADYVIGREPEMDPSVMAGDARPLPIPDATGTLSRVHAQIQLVDWNVLVTDLGSANGTRVRRPGDSGAEQLVPRVPALLRPGCRVDLGGRRLHYESHRGR